MDSSSNTKNTEIPPTDASEGKLDEKMDVVHFEVMDTIDVTTILAHDTEAS